MNKINEIMADIGASFRTFGGGHLSPNSNNPIAHALKDRPLQFAAGVDVADVVRTVISSLREPSDEMAAAVGSSWGPALESDWRAMIDAALNEAENLQKVERKTPNLGANRNTV